MNSRICDSSDGMALNLEKEAQLQQAITAFMQPPFFNDICIRIVTIDLINGLRSEEQVLANKFLLAFFSLHLRELILSGIYSIDGSSGMLNNIPTVELHLGTIANAGQAFRAILRYLYTGVLAFTTVHPFQVLQVSRICRIPMVEMQVTEFVQQLLSIQFDEQHCFARLSNINLTNSNPVNLTKHRHYDSILMKTKTKESTKMSVGDIIARSNLPIPRKLAYFSTSSNTSSLTGRSGNMERFNEVILPTNEKEGWCRNKKYIEQVANGYMCTVCRKVYGRYNSVSYHVTIYHRNPPIKCGEKGCPFRTREARYIHFHKYYRHHIPLPDNIDLGSRKCPFCRHVSKSPAMLEKHISRHVQDIDKTAVPSSSSSARLSPGHFQLASQAVTDLQCSQCCYRGQASDDLEQHKQFVHGKEFFQPKDNSLPVEISKAESVTDEDFERTTNDSATIITSPATSDKTATITSTLKLKAVCLETPKA